MRPASAPQRSARRRSELHKAASAALPNVTSIVGWDKLFTSQVKSEWYTWKVHRYRTDSSPGLGGCRAEGVQRWSCSSTPREVRIPRLSIVEATAKVRTLLLETEPGHGVWIEEVDEEVDLDLTFEEAGIHHRHHVHRGRCRRVKVVVQFNADDFKHEYGPGTTIKTVYHWASGDKAAKLSPEQKASTCSPSPAPITTSPTGSTSAPWSAGRTMRGHPRTSCRGTASPDDRRGRGPRRACPACPPRPGTFLAGVEAGRWRLVSVEWPIVTVMVSAAPREGAPTEFAIRFELGGYPNTTPPGASGTRRRTPLWLPTCAPRALDVALIFRIDGWAGGPTAMYAPWDRLALQTHPNWLQEAPAFGLASRAEPDLHLDNLHRVLNDDGYLGI